MATLVDRAVETFLIELTMKIATLVNPPLPPTNFVLDPKGSLVNRNRFKLTLSEGKERKNIYAILSSFS